MKFRFISILFLTAMLFSCGASKEKEEYSSYLFTYFTGNGEGEEAIRYAISPDGYNYYALNNNQPILSSDKISNTGGVRDPHLLRSNDGKTFYMVVTDLLTKRGWNNHAMVLLKSNDLVNWTSTVVNIPETFPEFSEVNRVWAPQTIYDEDKDKYMIYFSMLEPGGYDIIYYAYVNDEFTGLESAPKQLL
jgi:beta-xylosidase